MDPLSFVIAHNTLLAALITFALGIWVYYERRHDARNVAFGTLLLVVSSWMFALGLWRNAEDVSGKIFWLRTIFFLGSLIPLLFLVFVSTFVRGKFPPLWAQALMALPNVFLFGVAYLSDAVVADVMGNQVVAETGQNLFAVHLAVLLIASFAVVFRGSRRGGVKDSNNLIYVLLGAIIAFDAVFGVLYGTRFTDEPNSILLANVCLVVGMGVMATSVIDKNFIARVRLLGPQLFMVITLFVVLLNIVITQAQIDFTLRAVMMIILMLYTALITRTLIDEVRRMQQVQMLNEHALKLNKNLIEADRLKSRFVSLASHQMRAPVSGVRMYLEMFKEGNFGRVSKDQVRILDTNIQALNLLESTIDTFLDAAKIQLGKLELLLSEVELAKLAKQAVAELEPLGRKKGIKVVAVIPADLPHVTCDEGKIFHVIMNLLDNSIKYTKEGQVCLSLRKEGDQVAVQVKDTGIGMTDVEKSRLFEVFSRGMEAVRLDTGGSGLGLFIVKHILDAHKAKITFVSKGRNKGSTFCFSLPAA